MAHALTERKNGFVEYAYLESHGKAWHGLGQAVTDAEQNSIEVWQAKAGMDWLALGAPVAYAPAGGPGLRTVPGQQVLYRNDTGDSLGVVSDSYKIVQPRDVLKLFDELMRAGGLRMSSAGTTFGGRIFWATAKITEIAPVTHRDSYGLFLLASSSLDGSRATELRKTSIRVVCNNTFRLAMSEGTSVYKLSHRSLFNLEEFKRQAGLTDDEYRAFRDSLVRLANKPVSIAAAEEFTARLLATAATQQAADAARKSRGFDKVMALFSGEQLGADLDGVQGTAYGLLNAVTEYTTHHVRARSAEHRFDASVWGSGDKLNQAAMAGLLALPAAV